MGTGARTGAGAGKQEGVPAATRWRILADDGLVRVRAQRFEPLQVGVRMGLRVLRILLPKSLSQSTSCKKLTPDAFALSAIVSGSCEAATNDD